MKKTLLIIGGIILIIIFTIGYKFNSALNEFDESFSKEHKLSNPNFVLLSDSISPNGKFKYLEYQFDNGGFGYSRVFWSIVENRSNLDKLERGILPDGYKAVGWNKANDLIVEKWEPYYYKEKEVELNTGNTINGVKIFLIK